VNLKLSKLLARRLRARAFNVVMTREDDRFINLEERTVIAESEGGDIFVSIHANASKRKSLRGIEIYYLDENHERHTLELAARENGVRKTEVDDLARIVAQLRVSEASIHSRRLAGFVHDDIVKGLSTTYRSVPDLGVKKGPFYVLFMSSMPAILVETGFVTNRQEAKLLRSERYLDTLAAQIAAGLGHYRNHGRGLTVEARGGALPPVGAGR
jgi:N-acetylmuramoyl-L-alanine amidase